MSIHGDQPAPGIRHGPGGSSMQADQLRDALEGLHAPPGSRPPLDFGFGALLQRVASYWWIELLVGIFWVVIAIVILKFDHASISTVGILTGLMFLVFAAEDFLLAAIDRGPSRWLWAGLGVLMTAAGIVALIHPRSTFAGFADIIGFVFLLIAVKWMIQAFAERPVNGLWWMTLMSSILMLVLAFWISDRLFAEKAYTLLIFAGVWAMTNGVIAIVRAFAIREFGRTLSLPLPR